MTPIFALVVESAVEHFHDFCKVMSGADKEASEKKEKKRKEPDPERENAQQKATSLRMIRGSRDFGHERARWAPGII